MEQRAHWWNGRHGRLAREDVFLREDAGLWYVEFRRNERSAWREYDSEDAARADVTTVIIDDDWRDLTSLIRGQSRNPPGGYRDAMANYQERAARARRRDGSPVDGVSVAGCAGKGRSRHG